MLFKEILVFYVTPIKILKVNYFFNRVKEIKWQKGITMLMGVMSYYGVVFLVTNKLILFGEKSWKMLQSMENIPFLIFGGGPPIHGVLVKKC